MHYDPLTGHFTWNFYDKASKKLNSRCAGKPAGCVRTGGGTRLVIRIDGVLYHASRLAWLYMTGGWPEYVVDHVDQNSQNNKWENLRDVPNIDNCRNQRKRRTNTSGVMGVWRNKKSQKWEVELKVSGVKIYGGAFTNFDDAAAKRKAMLAEHQFHPNHGAERS